MKKYYKLGKFTQIRTGKLDANASSENGKYPFFTCAIEPLKIDTYSYDCECVLVAGNGDLNVKYYIGKFDAYQRTYIIESKDKNVLFVRYLYHFLDKYVETLRELSIGGVIKYIKLGNLTDADVPLPPLETQKQIAANLDKVTHTIDLCNNILEKLDLLVKARFVEMFGDTLSNEKKWNTLPLYQILEAGSAVTYGIVQLDEVLEGGIPVFRPIDIANGKIPKRDELKQTTKVVSDKYKRTLLKGYELLITVRGSIGETYRIDNSFAGCNVGRNIVPLRFNTKLVLYEFMQQFFEQSGTKRVLSSLTKGIALQGLNMTEFREIEIILPPCELQQQFAAFVEQTDKSKSAVKQVLEKAETLKKALMQEYFG